MYDVEDDLGEKKNPENSRHTWKFVVDALMKWLMTEEVLQSENDEIERAVEIPGD